MEELKPCPFCGRTDTLEPINFNEMYGYQEGEDAYHQDPRYTIVCNRTRGGCGATGGYKKDVEQAIENWNACPDGWVKFTVEKDEDGVEMYSSPIPDDEQEILVSDGEIIWLDIFVNEGDEGCYFDNGREIVPNFTHWMPLPEPPKGE